MDKIPPEVLAKFKDACEAWCEWGSPEWVECVVFMVERWRQDEWTRSYKQLFDEQLRKARVREGIE